MTKVIVWIVVVAAVLAGAFYAAYQTSSWPSALMIRYAIQGERQSATGALEKHVPQGVTAVLNERYDPDDGDTLLDVFYPTELAPRPLVTIVWMHGGGFVAGSKDEIANYAKILAGNGFTVVTVGYSLAPGRIYPTPVRQANAALAYLVENAGRLSVNASRFVLAGDSTGAHIAAQLANAISVPSYAETLGIEPSIDRLRLAGAMLYSGPYDVTTLNLEGPFGDFLRTVLWSYSGSKDFATNPNFATASVVNYVTPEFPPLFISAGNGDPLLPQSVAFADAVEAKGVRVDRLFFPADRKPPLPHAYQFNLDDEAGKLALERSLKFLSAFRLQ